MSHAHSLETRHYDTIIVGAGIAGLSCAARLFRHPHFKKKENLLVLEARDRIGGRIGSVTVNGCRLDTGANWIHGIGTEDNPDPLMKVLPHKRYRQLAGVVSFRAPDYSRRHDESTSEDEWIHVEDSKSELIALGHDLVISADVAGPMMGSLWALIGELRERALKTPPDEAKRTTVLSAIAKSNTLSDTYQEIPSTLHQTLAGMPQFVENMEAAPLAAQSAEHPQGMPGFGLLEFANDDFEGDQVFLQDGYTAVVNDIAKELVSAGLVELDTDVQKVKWNEGPIIIETNRCTYTARELVCTLPLGVLQHDIQEKSSIFEPDLPKDKLDAILGLGFGTLDKIFLIYDQPWWEDEQYFSIYKKGIVKMPTGSEKTSKDQRCEAPDSFMGFTDELAGIVFNKDGTTTTGLRILSLINLKNLTGFPVLSAFVSCSNASQIESLTENQAGSIIHRALTTWFGVETPKPSSVYVTRWAADSYSRGSYSHMIASISEIAHRKCFQQPIINDKSCMLRFAGEHTSINHFATVHGALLSGWREADEILKKGMRL